MPRTETTNEKQQQPPSSITFHLCSSTKWTFDGTCTAAAAAAAEQKLAAPKPGKSILVGRPHAAGALSPPIKPDYISSGGNLEPDDCT